MTMYTTTHGNVKAVALVKSTPIRRGAYQMETYAVNTKRAALGAKQQQIASDLKLEAKGNLTRQLYAAGWHTEQLSWGGKNVILWWPKI